MSADLSGLLLPSNRGAGTQLITRGLCTAWDAVTHRNTVAVGTVTYTNLAVLNVVGMATGAVLLVNTGGPPIILGLLTVPT